MRRRPNYTSMLIGLTSLAVNKYLPIYLITAVATFSALKWMDRNCVFDK